MQASRQAVISHQEEGDTQCQAHIRVSRCVSKCLFRFTKLYNIFLVMSMSFLFNIVKLGLDLGYENEIRLNT